MKTTYDEVTAFITKDKSVIRELLHPTVHGPGAMSFAEATVDPGNTTLSHLHALSEEIYHISEGSGTMRLGHAEFDIVTGDTIVIPPGTKHNVTNTGLSALKILCVCHPAYSDADTVLL